MWVANLYATPQSDSHSAHFLSTETGRSMLHVCKESHTYCRITHNILQTACSLFTEPAMTLQILSCGRESALRPSPSSFYSLSNPAHTTLMTSAVKTQRVNVSPPPPRPILRRIPGGRHWRGGDRRSQVWRGPDAWFEGS